MYQITNTIRKAVEKQAAEVGGFTALARLVGCHSTLTHRIAKDKQKTGISPKIMEALFPYIRNHLAAGEIEQIEHYLRLRAAMAERSAKTGAVFPPEAMAVIENLQTDLDKLLSSRKSNWVNEPGVGLYGDISTEARLLAERYDSLPMGLRRQILADILEHITKGESHETSKGKTTG